LIDSPLLFFNSRVRVPKNACGSDHKRSARHEVTSRYPLWNRGVQLSRQGRMNPLAIATRTVRALVNERAALRQTAPCLREVEYKRSRRGLQSRQSSAGAPEACRIAPIRTRLRTAGWRSTIASSRADTSPRRRAQMISSGQPAARALATGFPGGREPLTLEGARSASASAPAPGEGFGKGPPVLTPLPISRGAVSPRLTALG